MTNNYFIYTFDKDFKSLGEKKLKDLSYNELAAYLLMNCTANEEVTPNLLKYEVERIFGPYTGQKSNWNPTLEDWEPIVDKDD